MVSPPDQPSGLPAGIEHGRVPGAEGHRGALWWRCAPPRPALSSASVGGGLREVAWVLNVGVAHDYARTDLATHAVEVAGPLGLVGPGTTLFTAVPVERVRAGQEHGVHAWSTVGVTRPTWPAERGAVVGRPLPGTVNTVVVLPVRLTPEALVQAALSATEAKAQACVEAGLPGTGTASDALVVLAAAEDADAPVETFGGVRSTWGARVALAVHAAVTAGLAVRPGVRP